MARKKSKSTTVLVGKTIRYKPSKDVVRGQLVTFMLADGLSKAQIKFRAPARFGLLTTYVTLNSPGLSAYTVRISEKCPLGAQWFTCDTSSSGQGGEGPITGDVDVVKDPPDDGDPS
jgi:hypothetical protein